MGFPEGRGCLDPPKSGFEIHLSMGWVAARGPPIPGADILSWNLGGRFGRFSAELVPGLITNGTGTKNYAERT
jgi:hypothetical protein